MRFLYRRIGFSRLNLVLVSKEAAKPSSTSLYLTEVRCCLQWKRPKQQRRLNRQKQSVKFNSLQGDPLGPAIFSMAIHQTISKLNSKFNLWYIGSDAETVLNALQRTSVLSISSSLFFCSLNDNTCFIVFKEVQNYLKILSLNNAL